MRGLGIAGIAGPAGAVPATPAAALRPRTSEPLNGVWQFRTDPRNEGEARGWHLKRTAPDGWRDVVVPHTWQVEPELSSYQGAAWYRRIFETPDNWMNQAVRLEFEAVYHSATVWLNGELLGRHTGKGYTAFTFDLTPHLKPVNTLIVRADNSFDETMLPRGKSFDWTVDGGVYRPVNLLITPAVFIERIEIDADPGLVTGQANVGMRAAIRNTTGAEARLLLSYRIREEDTGRTVARQDRAAALTLASGSTEQVALAPASIPGARLWHFDHPNLYRVEVAIEAAGAQVDRLEEVFGIRRFEVRDGAFHLNGERVRLMGVERMAGSNPRFGMAEPSSWITHDHADMKHLNCVFTRVHWPQDRRLLDYCDRHGILIQLEVPAWGPDTFKGMAERASAGILQNGLEQLTEMIRRDRNHPSVCAWGLCNEVNGRNPAAQHFVRTLHREAKRLNPGRLCTYASNSLQGEAIGKDVAGELDFVSWNEYYGSWYGGKPADMRANLEAIRRAFPSKPIVISEYGYCECRPEFTAADVGRIAVMREHDAIYREYDWVGGAVFFCYNDYRTHIGDKGLGVLKQRVHGVVDLNGARKPSYEALRSEASPVERLTLTPSGTRLTAEVEMRKTLPAYTAEGYKLRWLVFAHGGLPMEEHETPLPKLLPGAKASIALNWQEPAAKRVRVDIVRPTGYSVLTAEWMPATP